MNVELNKIAHIQPANENWLTVEISGRLEDDLDTLKLPVFIQKWVAELETAFNGVTIKGAV